MKTRSEIQLTFSRLAAKTDPTDLEELALDMAAALLNVYDILDGLENNRDSLGRLRPLTDILWMALTNDYSGLCKLEKPHKIGG